MDSGKSSEEEELLSRTELHTFCLSSLPTDFLVCLWSSLSRDLGGISSLHSSTVHCGQASYASAQTHDILVAACGLSKLAIRDSVTEIVVNKTKSFKETWNLVLRLSLVIGYGLLKVIGLWKGQRVYEQAIQTKQKNKYIPSTPRLQLFL